MLRASLAVLIALLAASCGGSPTPAEGPSSDKHGSAQQAAADAGAELAPLADAPAGDYWARVRTVVGPNDQSEGIIVEGKLCFGADKPARVVCRPLAAGGQPSELALPESKDPLRTGALVAANGLLYQVHSLPGRLLVHELDVAKGRMLRRIELPLLGAGDRRARVLLAEGGKLFIASGGPTVIVDIARGEIVGKLQLGNVHTSALGSPLFVGREDNAPIVVRVNATDGTTLWKHTGKKSVYLDGITEWGKRVALLDSDGNLGLLDAQSGKLLSEKRLQKNDKRAGSVPPLVDGEELLVVADRLYRLSSTLAPSAQAELPEYLFGNLLVVGDELLAASRHSVFVFDRRTLALKQKLENHEDWQFSGELRRAPEGVIATNELRYNSEIATHFLHLRPIATGRIDRAALPTDAVVYLEGKPLSDLARVPPGDHVLDLLRIGHRPASTKARIEAGKTTTLAAVDWKPVSSPVSTHPRLPPGAQLAKLLAAVPRRIPYPATFAAYIAANGGDRHATFSEKTGLQFLDARTGKVTAKRSFADMIAELGEELPARWADKTRRPPGIALGLLSAEAGLLFVSTEGDLTTHLAAFDAATGQRRWTQSLSLPLPVMSSKGGGYFTSTFWVAHGLFWHRDEHTLFARDLATGRLALERYDDAEDLSSDLLFTKDSVIFLQNERVQRMQLFSGKVLWSVPVPKPAELYLDAGSTEIFAVSESSVRRISLDGKVLATSGAMAGHIDDNPAFIDDDFVYVCGHFKNRVFALRRKDLSQAWSYFEKSGASPCPLAADDHDLLLGDGGTRMLVDKRTGQVKQKLGASDLPDRLWPVFSVGSELCFPTHDATLCVRR